MYCKKCGKHLLEYEKVCPECGEEIIDLNKIDKSISPIKSKTYDILSIVFGSISLVSWIFIIYLGYLFSIIGIVISFKAFDKGLDKVQSKVGMILNVIGLIITLIMHWIIVF